VSSTTRVALVTGGGSGIGRAASLLFAREGTKVVVADVDADHAEETVKLVAGEGGDATACSVDVRDDESVAAMVTRAVDTYGRLDCAFNNAGISPVAKPFVEHTLAEWQRVIDVNLTGVFLCMQPELRHMVEQGGGAIVNTSSGAGVVAAPGQPQYTAAKHGVLGLTKQAAQEYARAGIRVNAILPGMTDTPMRREYLEEHAAMTRMLPFGRLATPEEVAGAAVWLCSDAAAYVSGASLVVDGATICR
jgi:NAD(P)-dependent dehydrogenase (short-subunit alcohol dehydrogenase family)